MHKADCTQDDIIARIYDVAAKRALRVCHDQHDPHSAPADSTTAGPESPTDPVPDHQPPVAPVKKKTTGAVPAPIIRQKDGTFLLAIAKIFDGPGYLADDCFDSRPPSRDSTVGRLMLSGEPPGGHGASRGNTVLAYECNGLVLDARTWRPLVVPPGAFNHRPSTRDVDAFIADRAYDVIRVDDGTVVTLYCWEHPLDGKVWCLSTGNGYDVSSLSWMGPLTFAEIFYDLAARVYPEFCAKSGMTLEKGPGERTRLQFKHLNPNRCYTVGFRHHNFHPMKADPERMWQIQCTDLSGPVPVTIQYLSLAAAAGLPGVPWQVPCSLQTTGATVEELRARGTDAIARAEAFIKFTGAVTALAGSEPSSELNYGYILRSREPARTGVCSDVLLETPLLARIRKIVYERAPRDIRPHLTACDRLEYNAMRAFLTASYRDAFLSLYPDWSVRFQAYKEFTDNIVSHMINILRQRALEPSSCEPALKSATGDVARALIAHIACHENLMPFHKDTHGIVRDYVLNSSYAFLYLHTLRLSRKKALLAEK
jgi:hypothetical protein